MSDLVLLIGAVLLALIIGLSVVFYSIQRSWKIDKKNILHLSRVGDLQDGDAWAEAGLKISKKMYFLYTFLVGLGVLIFVWLGSGKPQMGLLGFICVIIGAAVKVKMGSSKRMGAFSDQLAEALPQVAENMRAGLTVEKAFRAITESYPPPMSSEFNIVYNEINYGTNFATAINNMSNRVNNKDLALLSVAIYIQNTTGGNLAETLETISQTINDRMQIQRDIKTKTSQVTIALKIVAALPWVLLGILMLMSKDMYVTFYTSMKGIVCLIVVVIFEAIGTLIITNMAKVKVD